MPLRVNWPLTPRTELSPLHVMTALAMNVGLIPPVFDVWPLFGRLSSPPGPAAETVAGATSAAPRSPATANQPAIRNLCFCIWSLLPIPRR